MMRWRLRARVGLSLGIAMGWLVLTVAPPMAQEVRPTLDKIKETGAVNFGYRETSLPFSFVDKDGKPVGYSVDLCTHVAEAIRTTLGLAQIRVNWVPETPANRIQQLVRGVTDLGCGSSTITFARMEQVDFSHMTFVDGGSLLATADSGILAVKELGGKRVGVIPNTTTEKALATALARAGVQAQVIAIQEHKAGLEGLEAGRLDAYATDRVLLMGLLAQASNPTRLRLSPEMYSYEPYGLMMRRGDNAFRVQVNRALSRLYRSGQVVAVYEKWFGPMVTASPLAQALYLLHSWPE